MKTISISRWVAAGTKRGCVRSPSRRGHNNSKSYGWSTGPNRALLAFVVWLLGSLATSAQVNRTIGTLPPGGSVTITFDVTINGSFPANTSSVTNQGNVTGTGFVVFTDDPLTFAANDPTVTAVTVAPQISCPANLVTNGNGDCLLPSVSFGATVTAGIPAPTLTYKLGTTVITSPYTFPAGTNIVTVTATNGTTPNAACAFTVTVLANPPQLNIARGGTNIVLSWPASYSCYNLQVSPALLASTVWTPYPGPFTTINGTIYVTNGITTTNHFFRLSAGSTGPGTLRKPDLLPESALGK